MAHFVLFKHSSKHGEIFCGYDLLIIYLAQASKALMVILSRENELFELLEAHNAILVLINAEPLLIEILVRCHRYTHRLEDIFQLLAIDI